MLGRLCARPDWISVGGVKFRRRYVALSDSDYTTESPSDDYS